MFSDPEGIALPRRVMKASKLKIGDRIRITAVPGAGDPNYYTHPSTIRAYKKLISRNRPVRIKWIDEYGSPWFTVMFRTPAGKPEWHSFGMSDEKDNWVPVKSRRRASRRKSAKPRTTRKQPNALR